MCYSAQVHAAYSAYVRAWGADIDIHAFVRLYGLRAEGAKLRIPKALDLDVRAGTTPAERAIAAMIEAHDRERLTALERELFAQRKRLADAERTLQTKQTKSALDSQRIATAKISKARLDLEDLRRTELLDRDSRIFPGVYAPVMVVRDGQKVVLPMRYQCRPAGRPASYDAQYPGTYNAMGAFLTVRTTQILRHQ